MSRLTGVPEERCVDAIEEGLLAGYRCEPNPETGFPVFAFRLHQFISRGETVYASVEPEPDRFVTVQGQRFVPGRPHQKSVCRSCSVANAGRSITVCTFPATQNPSVNDSRHASYPRTGRRRR